MPPLCEAALCMTDMSDALLPRRSPDIGLRCRYTLRFARAEPCDCPVHRPIVTCGVLVECPGPMDDLALEPVLFHNRFYRTCCVIIQSERSDHLNRLSPHSTTTDKTGCVYECTERRPCCSKHLCIL